MTSTSGPPRPTRESRHPKIADESSLCASRKLLPTNLARCSCPDDVALKMLNKCTGERHTPEIRPTQANLGKVGDNVGPNWPQFGSCKRMAGPKRPTPGQLSPIWFTCLSTGRNVGHVGHHEQDLGNLIAKVARGSIQDAPRLDCSLAAAESPYQRRPLLGRRPHITILGSA